MFVRWRPVLEEILDGGQRQHSHEPFPKQIKLSDGTEVTIRRMEPDDQEKILAFAAKLPEQDLLFLRTDITDRPRRSS